MGASARFGWLVLPIALACGDSSAVADGETDGDGSTGGTGDIGPAFDLCASALDPEVYTSPAWTPAPVVATPECPAGAIEVELTSVEITGVVRVAGSPAEIEGLRLVGRGDEGTARFEVGLDGSFGGKILRGRYDVWAFIARGARVPVERLAVKDFTVDGPGELVVDLPELATVSGTMMIDGEPAADPYAHLFVREVGTKGLWFASTLVERMERGEYSVQLAPGRYEFEYMHCSPFQAPGPHAPPTPCYDPEAPEFAGEIASPVGRGMRVATVDVEGDATVNIDVPTVRFSADVSVEGTADKEPYGRIVGGNDEGIYLSLEGGRFQGRVVAATYALWAHAWASPIDAALVLDEDTQLEISLRSHPLEIAFDSGPLASFEPQIYIQATGAPEAWEFDPYAPVPLHVFEGTHRIVHGHEYCWPDARSDAPRLNVVAHAAYPVNAAVDLLVGPPELARVALSYRDDGVDEHAWFSFVPEGEDHPVLSNVSFFPRGEAIEGHGLLPVGRYRLFGEVVDIVDGTTIRVLETSRPADVRIRVDGTPSESRVTVRPRGSAESQWADSPLRPGRYDILYRGTLTRAEEANNHDAIVGCVTIES